MRMYTPENETPNHFDLSHDDDGVPQRELSDFIVTRGDDKISICSLDDSKNSNRNVIARGTVSASGKSLKIISAPLIEWCIEYGQTPHLWVRSAQVWYRLAKPAKEYSRTHDLARRRFELCSRIYILATTMPTSECTYKFFTQLLAGPYEKMKGYSEKELLMEKDFILAQIKNLNEVAIADIPFVKELKEKKGGKSKSSNSTSKKKENTQITTVIGISNANGTSPNLSQWSSSGKLDKEGSSRLLKRLEKAVSQLYKSKLSWPFRNPVDPQNDECPDYLERIKRPMDYGTIKSKLEKGLYKAPIEVAQDVRQIAANCKQYNGDGHQFTLWANELEQKFENLIRSGEEAEIAAMAKRSAKKRRNSDLPPSGKNSNKKAKTSKKDSKTNSPALSPSVSTPSKDEENTNGKLCARSSTDGCGKVQLVDSKYCSDECGMIVARQRISELSKAGFSIDDYVRSFITKALVHSRS